MKRCKQTVRTLRIRLKDRHATVLAEMARAVNFTWNYCNELSMKVLEPERRFINATEMQKYLNAASKEGLAVDSAVFQQVAEEYVTRRAQHKKRRFALRESSGSRRSLGWIPFKKRSLVYRNGWIQFQERMLNLWDSYGLKDYELGAGSISEDARGRWCLNVTVQIQQAPQNTCQASLGIDLGPKEFAGFSDDVLETSQHSGFIVVWK